MLHALARREPVLLAVDDVQWLDPQSQAVVSFAARRLGEGPIGVLTTQRGDGRDPLDLRRALDERVEEIELGALSVGALHQLVRSRLDVRIPRPALARVHSASGGNPMFALEFARSVTGRGGPQFGPLPMPASLDELVRERVAGYPPELRPLLALVAAVERPTPSLLAAIDAGAGALLDEASELGAVTLGDDGVIRFPPPLLASAVYAALPAGQRRALHARVAAVSHDLEERARHLALAAAGPDADVAALLDKAAARARARGAPAAAAEFAQQAVRLTPPAQVADRDDRGLAVVGYLADSGRTTDASAYLDEALARGIAGPRRARALLLRITVDHDLEIIGPAAEEALEYVGEDLALRARALLVLSSYQLYREDVVASEQSARQALAAAEEIEDPALLATALAVVASRADQAGRPEPALRQRSVALADDHGTLPYWPTPRGNAGRALLRDGDLDGAREMLAAELDAMLRRGMEPERWRIVVDLADLECRAGNWQLAEQHLEDAWEVAVDGDDLYAKSFTLLSKARLAALRGRVDESRRLLSEAAAHGDRMHWPYFAAVNRWVRGFLELSRGEPPRACEALEDIPRTLPQPSRRNREVMPAVADAVEALVALGRLEEAEELLAALVAEAKAGHRWAGSAVLRSRALLQLARGETERALGVADESAGEFQTSGFPLDRARALLIAGDALRRLGERRRAAEKLEAAKAVFVELGAQLWVERAEKELRRASPRPRRDRELTSAERRVAALVAAGRTNREVAAQLFTTVATVEAHLTRIYRKVGMRSRTELARRVAEGTLSIADE
ncbi:MAG TPA: LuxR C-terminal-related transcriptional regulator [Gaiellaceae bacterium]